MANPSKKCRWIITGASIGVQAVYCEKPVSYTMPEDDDKNRSRQYNTFCDYHQKKADAMDEDEGYDDI